MARRRRFGPRSERGAVVVEAALVTPLLMALVLGIIEMALLMKDDVALTSAVRNGGRIASANAGAGPGGVAADDGSCLSPCSPASAPMFAQMAANAIQTAGGALPKDSIQELWIYKANDKGYPGADGSTAMVCGTNCVKYKWMASKDQFRYFSGSWTSTSVNACANNNPDSVGVYMKAQHSFVSGFFSRNIMIDDHAVFTFEPLPTLTCSPGSHA
jgi:Flp pilus assembly protein TadG